MLITEVVCIAPSQDLVLPGYSALGVGSTCGKGAFNDDQRCELQKIDVSV